MSSRSSIEGMRESGSVSEWKRKYIKRNRRYPEGRRDVVVGVCP
jgi:hypothetical protein